MSTLKIKLKFKPEFQKIINDLKKNNLKFFIGGGAVLSAILNQEDEQDLDIFFRTADDYYTTKNFLSLNHDVEYETNNAITFIERQNIQDKTFDVLSEPTKIQIIRRSFGTPEEIISNFDLNKSMVAYENDELIIDSRFKEPLHITKKHTNSLKRLFKYNERLYNFQKNNSKYKNIHYIDWCSTVEDFNNGEMIPDFYDNSVKSSKDVLKNFLKSLFTNLTYSECVQDDKIKKMLNDMVLSNALELIKGSFIPADYLPTYYFEKVHFLRVFSKKNRVIDMHCDNVLKKYILDVKHKNPELLFEMF